MTDEYDIDANEILCFDAPSLKIQFEAVRKVNRNVLKFAEKEIGNLNTTITRVGSFVASSNREEAVRQLDAMADRMRRLKRKLDELYTEERKMANVLGKRCAMRLDVMKAKTLKDTSFHQYSKLRLKRALVDHLIGCGQIDLAKKIAEAYSIEEFVDIDYHANILKIATMLRQGNACEALSWCNENRVPLRDRKSTLELNIRLQEFIELARNREHQKCLEYAEKHLSVFSEDKTLQPTLMPVVTLLIFPPDFVCGKYAALYDPTRWDAVANMFLKEALEQNFVPRHSVLEIVVKTGLSAFKTNMCGATGDNANSINCPACCTPEFRSLVSNLPLGHHSNSTFICPITGRVMTDADHPMVTPDGMVYSITGVNETIASNGGRLFICPKTLNGYHITALRRMYLT